MHFQGAENFEFFRMEETVFFLFLKYITSADFFSFLDIIFYKQFLIYSFNNDLSPLNFPNSMTYILLNHLFNFFSSKSFIF